MKRFSVVMSRTVLIHQTMTVVVDAGSKDDAFDVAIDEPEDWDDIKVIDSYGIDPVSITEVVA